MMIWCILLQYLLHLPILAFSEHLDITPLPRGHLLAHFQFTQSHTIPSSPKKSKHLTDYGTFPGAIVEVVQEHGLDEFRLSFGRGRWDEGRWGRSPVRMASTGIQLHAWFNSLGKGSVDQRWEKLTHILSGLFCGSIGLLNEAKTTVPLLTFAKDHNSAGELRFGVLPREAVCTENLTPWAKMLPCMTNAGLAALLNPIKLFDSRYILIDLLVKTRPLPNGQVEILLEQNLAVVFDLLRWHHEADWTLTHLFERRVEALCPLSKDTAQLSHHYDAKESTLQEQWTQLEHGSDEDVGVARYRGEQLLYKEIGLEFKELGIEKIRAVPKGQLPLADVHILRVISGSGQERGTLFTQLENVSARPIPVLILEVLPWFMRLYMHTLRLQSSIKDHAPYLSKILYSPALDRVKPAQIEYEVVLQPGEMLVVEIDFDMTLLRYSEYPLDPNRGFDVNGAIMTYRTEDGKLHQAISNTLLLTVPTPDFTMPFNVIMLTSLAMTFFYGYFFNLSFRRFYLHDPTKPRNLLGRLKLWLSSRRKQKAD